MFEGEGCVAEHRVSPTCKRRILVIQMTDRDVLERFSRIVGVGKVTPIPRGHWSKPHYKDQFKWLVCAYADVMMIHEKFKPWLGERRAKKFASVMSDPPSHPRALKKTHCKRGHALAGEGSDVRIGKGPTTQRFCRICLREVRRVFKARDIAA